MAANSKKHGSPPELSNVIALWRDGSGGLHEIDLNPTDGAVVLQIKLEPSTEWTADGRGFFGRTTNPRLSKDDIIRIPRPPA